MRIRPAIIVLHCIMLLIMRPVLRMPLIFAAGILVMTERHALCRHDRRHSLGRDAQGEEQDCEKAEETLRHRRALYALL